MRVVAGQRMLDERDEEEITFDVDAVTVHPGWWVGLIGFSWTKHFIELTNFVDSGFT